MRMDITGNDLTMAFHSNGSRKAFSAGSRAAVQNRDIFFGELCTQNTELCSRVLDIEQTFLKRRKVFNAAGTGQHQAVPHPAVGLGAYLLLFQTQHQLVCGDPQGIHLDHCIRRGIVGDQHRLQLTLGKVRL